MKSATRFLTLIGAGVMVATAFAVPAQAAPATGTTPARAAVQQRDRDWDHDDWEFRGYYDTRRECNREGRWGERRDRWEDWYCEEVERGRHRDEWKLLVEDDDDWRRR